MNNVNAAAVSLTSTWFIKPGCEEAADQALNQLAIDVCQNEPGTLTYLIHKPFLRDRRLQSLPPVDPLSILFYETYRSPDAFFEHLHGAVFTNFLRTYGELFVAANGNPFTFVDFLETSAGFVRAETKGLVNQAAHKSDVVNQHPTMIKEVFSGKII